MSKYDAVNVVMKLFKVMSDDEKRDTVLEMGEILEQEGLASKWGEAETKPRIKAGAKAKRRGSSRPYWIKRIDKVDPSAKGMDKLSGAWAKEDEFEEGKYYLIGTRSDPKTYHIGRGKSGASGHVVLWDGSRKEFNGLDISVNCDTFADVVEVFASMDI